MIVFKKNRPHRIYVISQVVLHMMLASVCSELDGRAVAIALLGEEMRCVQDVDVVVRPGHTEVSMLGPELMVSDGFEDHHRRLPLYPLVN